MEPLTYLISALLHVIAVLLGTLLGIQLRSKKFSVIKNEKQNLNSWFVSCIANLCQLLTV